MGAAVSNVDREIYKACSGCLVDRVMAVRLEAAVCLQEMLQGGASFLYTAELEPLARECVRGMEGSNTKVKR